MKEQLPIYLAFLVIRRQKSETVKLTSLAECFQSLLLLEES